jgi:aminoglycoside phosphotransferase
VREWVATAVGQSVVRVTRLDGASSTAVHRVQLQGGGCLVLRRYVWRGYLEAEPEAPGREIDALGYAAAHGLSVPQIVAADATGSEVGDGVPTILMTLLPGQPVLAPDPRVLAEVAAQIHDLDGGGLGHVYFPWYEDEMTSPPPQSSRPELWERAIDQWKTRLPFYVPGFVHRDFHPGNVLWHRRLPTGVVDWPNACQGPRGCDIAHCRWNLRHWAGEDAASEFVAAYTSLTGQSLDPFWIMAGLLEHDHEHWTDENLAADEPDLAQAVAMLSG